MFDWNDLRYFLAVARHGSTIAAAKALNLSQSTVHRRLAELEKRIGRNVVIRHATGYRLTEFGTGLQPWAEQVEKADRLARALSGCGRRHADRLGAGDMLGVRSATG